MIAALFSGLHTDFYRFNKIASLQTIQYGVSIDFLLLDFTKESMHWKLIPSYIQKFHFVDVIAMDNLLIRQNYAKLKINIGTYFILEKYR